jgi:hypothetical protein
LTRSELRSAAAVKTSVPAATHLDVPDLSAVLEMQHQELMLARRGRWLNVDAGGRPAARPDLNGPCNVICDLFCSLTPAIDAV